MTSHVPTFAWTLATLVVALNQNLVKKDGSKALTLLERQTLAMMHREVFGLPKHFYDKHAQNDSSTLGMMTSGGTLANITALWIARNACLGWQAGYPGVEEVGVATALKLHGYQDAVVVGSRLLHYSFDKAMGLLGFGADKLIKIAVDDRRRMDVRALRRTVAHCAARGRRVIAIVGIGGATDCGTIDPLSKIADVAEEAQIHFHVDAAWGAPLLFSDRHRRKMIGIERADSVTADGHKQLHLPVGTGMLLLHNPHAAEVVEKHASYMLQENSGDLGRRSLEGSRPATSMFVHAALHVIGRRAYGLLVDRSIRTARIMADRVQSRPEFQLLLRPATNIVLYRYVPWQLRPALIAGSLTSSENGRINLCNERLQQAQCRAGRTFVSRTTIDDPNGRHKQIIALRAVVGNFLTKEEDIDALLEDQAHIGAQLTYGLNTGRSVF
jgi:glutamate decarboxylase